MEERFAESCGEVMEVGKSCNLNEYGPVNEFPSLMKDSQGPVNLIPQNYKRKGIHNYLNQTTPTPVVEEKFAESSSKVTEDHAKVNARGQVASPPSVTHTKSQPSKPLAPKLVIEERLTTCDD